MKSIVIYFSQTGNTRKIGEAIGRGIALTTGDCHILKIKEVAPEDLIQYDLIGLGCPVFLYREPANVKAFIDNLPSLEGKHCFVFATHALTLGKTLLNMSWALSQKGMKVIGSYHCYAEACQPHIPYPYYTTGHPDEIELKEAEAFGRKMVGLSKRVTQGETDLIPNPQMSEWGEPPPFRGKMTFNKEKCRYPQCRLCVDHCPVNGIDLTADPIVFRRDCESCFFCEQICPYGAIEADWQAHWRARKERFKSLLEAADKAEQEGLLRKYFEVDTDNPDKIRFKVFPGRPRFTVS